MSMQRDVPLTGRGSRPQNTGRSHFDASLQAPGAMRKMTFLLLKLFGFWHFVADLNWGHPTEGWPLEGHHRAETGCSEAWDRARRTSSWDLRRPCRLEQRALVALHSLAVGSHSF